MPKSKKTYYLSKTNYDNSQKISLYEKVLIRALPDSFDNRKCGCANWKLRKP